MNHHQLFWDGFGINVIQSAHPDISHSGDTQSLASIDSMPRDPHVEESEVICLLNLVLELHVRISPLRLHCLTIFTVATVYYTVCFILRFSTITVLGIICIFTQIRRKLCLQL